MKKHHFGLPCGIFHQIKPLQDQFLFCPLLNDALCCIWIHENTWHDCISCFGKDMLFSIVNTSENKSNTSRKRESIPFSLHSSPRDLGFHFEPGFSVSANCLMMFWETESGHIKIWKSNTCHSVAILLYCMGKKNFARAIMPCGILVWLTTWRKKSNWMWNPG